MTPNTTPPSGSSGPQSDGQHPADPSDPQTTNGPQTGVQAVVHATPRKGSGLTPCCGRTPFELPRTDRISIDPFEVTCGEADAPTPTALRDTEVEQLRAELLALKAIARGYCGECGRGDCSPTADQYYEQYQRARRAEAAVARVRALATATRDATAPGRNDWQIGQHDLAVTVLAALDEPKEE
ncbi:hypothetical protein ACIRD2_03230 [Streptomyces sp. NPDC093595]|uniref:hypothetical protein n=1 Tax=Streptomyces sp. NPDC093595 TaxID=3366045 RepID=UPI00382FEC6E